MSFDQPWVWAVGSVIAGLLVGAVAAALARRYLGHEKRRAPLRAVAAPTSTFLFWLATATGVVFAIGATSPDTLKPIPRDIIDWMPNALVAGLLILGGYAAGAALSVGFGSTIERATGRSQRGVERVVRWAIMGAAIVLALGNLGVETTSLQIILAGVVFALALSFALIAGLGGRDVAANIASGRTLRSDLVVGATIVSGDVSGTVVDLRPALVVIETDDGRRVFVPFARLLDAPFEIGSAEP